MVRPFTPPWAFTYLKYAFAAGAISEYPGAAGPVSGWVLPMVTVVAVMPGADAVLAVDAGEELPQAAVSSAAAPPTAATAQVLDLVICGRMRVLLVWTGADCWSHREGASGAAGSAVVARLDRTARCAICTS